MAPQHPTPDPAEPFVSVVVPVLNNATGIAGAVEALLRQTYPADRYEILVTDNGSADDTRAVVEGFQRQHPERVRLLTEFGTRSSYAARNVAIEVAKGSILAFTDADCVPEPDWVAQGVRALERASADYAAGEVRTTFRGPRPTLWEHYDAVASLNQQRYMERYGFGATANLFVRRACIADHGDFRPELISGGDYEFGRRLARGGARGVYAPDAVVAHPARASAGAILRKHRRIQRGRRQLEALGVLDHGRLTWRSFVPVRRCPPLDGRRPGLLRRVAFVLAANFVRYAMLAIRIIGRFRPVPTAHTFPAAQVGAGSAYATGGERDG